MGKKRKVVAAGEEEEQPALVPIVKGSTGEEGNRRGSNGRRSLPRLFTHVDPAMNAAPTDAPKRMLSTYMPYEEEHLGEDFEDTPWLPPTAERALEFRERMIYRGGKSAVRGTKIFELEDMGIGVSLYFQFLKWLCGVFFVLSVLNVPALLLASSGSATIPQYQDAAQLYLTTLGNVGYPCEPDSPNPEYQRGCAQNATTVQTVYWEQYGLAEASHALAALETLGSIFFLVALLLWRRHSRLATAAVDDGKVTAADYAVLVEGLPAEADRRGIGHFFSGLYRLDAPDWKGRPELEAVNPVVVADNTSDSWYIGKWVAEISVARRCGSEIATYKRKRREVLHLKRCRAVAKMYKADTPLRNGAGADDSRHRRWVRKADAAGERIAQTTDKIMAKRADIDAKQACVGAFVLFNQPESVRRCLEDFKGMTRFSKYPKPLLFDGKHRLQVTRAEEPDNIIWENIEFSKRKRWLRQQTNALVAFLLLIVSFAVVLGIQSLKSGYASAVPSLGMCDTHIPALYVPGNYSGVAALYPDLALVRPPAADRASTDAQCQTALSSSQATYAVYSAVTDADTAWMAPAANYSVDACDAADACPPQDGGAGADVAQRCPCVDPSATEVCESLACAVSPDDTNCVTFTFSTVAGCYCYEKVFGSGYGKGTIGRVKDTNSADGDVCQTFLLSMTVAAGLSVVIAATTPIINALLVASSKVLVAWERNLSDDVAATRLMFSVFRAQFVNTGILPLLVYGRPPDGYTLPEPLPSMGVFDGSYDDFNRRWYSDAGVRIAMSFILAAIMPHISPLYRHFFVARSRRARAAARIAKGDHMHAMQYDVNQNFVGPVFDFTTRYSYVLTLLFVGYTYSGGIVIMPFLCFFFFLGTYWLDKLLLLRFYRRPPHRGDTLQQRANAVLPFALLLHLSFTIWMYGSPDVLQSDLLTEEGAYGQKISDAVSAYEDNYGIVVARVVRTNVFPLCVVWLIVAVVCLLETLGSALPIHLWVARGIRALCCCWARKRGSGKGATAAATENAPFTDIYYKFIPTGGTLETQEKLEGWFVSHLPDGRTVKKKGWSIDGDSMQPAGRDAKYTWEVVADNGVCSYRMEQVPGYAEIIAALKEEERLYKADLDGANDSDSSSTSSGSSDGGGGGTAERDASGGGGGGGSKRAAAGGSSGKNKDAAYNPFEGMFEDTGGDSFERGGDFHAQPAAASAAAGGGGRGGSPQKPGKKGDKYRAVDGGNAVPEAVATAAAAEEDDDYNPFAGLLGGDDEEEAAPTDEGRDP